MHKICKNMKYFAKTYLKKPPREKCPNTEFFLVRIFQYSVRIQENMDQKKSLFGHFSCSELVVRDSQVEDFS